jgi:hypothetical protein
VCEVGRVFPRYMQGTCLTGELPLGNNNSLLNVRFRSLLGPHGLLLIYIWGENSI